MSSKERVERAFQWVKKTTKAGLDQFMREATQNELIRRGYKVKRKKKHFHIKLFPTGRRLVDVYAEKEHERVICECESLYDRHKHRLDAHKNLLILPYWVLNYDEIWISGLETPKIIAKVDLPLPLEWYRQEIDRREEDAKIVGAVKGEHQP